MTFTKFVILTSAMAAASGSAFAQLPASRVLTVDVAQSIAQEAMAKCRADGYKVTVLVVDGLNAPKALLRDDGATASTTEVAKMKATATMLYNRPRVPPSLFRPVPQLRQRRFRALSTPRAACRSKSVTLQSALLLSAVLLAETRTRPARMQRWLKFRID